MKCMGFQCFMKHLVKKTHSSQNIFPKSEYLNIICAILFSTFLNNMIIFHLRYTKFPIKIINYVCLNVYQLNTLYFKT